MPWNYDDEEINGLVDANIKDSPPNPPGINTASAVRSMLKSFWTAVRSQVVDAVSGIELSLATMQTDLSETVVSVESRVAIAEAKAESVFSTFSLAKRLGVYNAATGIATISATGESKLLVAVPSDPEGSYYDVDVPGTNSVTGVPKNWVANDKIISAVTKWDRIPASGNTIDPKQSPNLIMFANQNAENWSLNGTGGTSIPKFYRQSGTAVVSIEKNSKGLAFWAKAIMQPSSRVNFVSNAIALDVLAVGAKVAIGYFLYIKPGTVLANTTETLFLRSPENNSPGSLATEMINLGGGVFYVRTTSTIAVPAYTNSLQLAVYLYADATTPADSEVWFGAPALIKSDNILTAQMYPGGDYVNFNKVESFVSEKISINSVVDAGFRKQLVGATALLPPWVGRFGGSDFLAPIVIETVGDGQIGSKAIRISNIKRSSDNKLSDFQLCQEIPIPANYIGASKMSFGIWVKRESAICTVADAPLIFYNALTGGVPTSVAVTPTYLPAIFGSWVFVRFENITVPAGSVLLSLRIRFKCGSAATLDAIASTWVQTPQVAFGSPTANAINLSVADEAEPIVDSKLAGAFGVPLLANGDYANGTINHSIISATTFLPTNAVVDQVSSVGTKALKVSNTKRVSDNLLSIIRDQIAINVIAGLYPTISFSILFKGDLTYLKAFCQIEFRTDSASVSTYTGLETSYIDLGDGWYRYYAQGVPIPATATVVRCGIRVETKAAATAGVIYESFHTGHMAVFGSAIVEFSKSKYQLIASQLAADTSFAAALSLLVNPTNYHGLQGIKVCFLGDSIIQANVNTSNAITSGYEVDRLVNRFGIIPYVRGTGGSRVVDNGQTAWYKQDADPALDGLYLARPDDGGTEPLTPHYTFTAAGSTAQRISTIPLDSQIIYIRFGTNDFLNYPVGDVNSPKVSSATDPTITFSGAYMLMLDLIYARVPNAIVILVTPTHRNGEDTAVGVGAMAGLRFEQIRQAIRNIACKYKYLLCDMSNTGINQLNHGTYLSDGIHPNAAGYLRMYRAAAATFKNIYGS